MKSQDRVVVYMDQGLKAAVDIAAEEEKENRSEWIRGAIEERLYRMKVGIPPLPR